MSDFEWTAGVNPIADLDLELRARARANVERVKHEEATRPFVIVPQESANPAFEFASRHSGLSTAELLDMAANLEPPPLRRDPAVEPSVMMRKAGVERRHLQHITQEPQDFEALRFVKAFMAEEKQWILVLSGGYGVGKTGSACWALGQLPDGMFFKAPDLLDAAFHDRERWARLRRARVVVFDDFGAKAEGNSAVADASYREKFNTAMDDWYGNGSKVIVTCNLSVASFVELVGERVRDRIREGGRFMMLGGESVRGSL